jgi:hypothetical protein
MRSRAVHTVAILLGSGLVASAQQPPGPRDTAKATINGKAVAVEYGRPALKGRTMDKLLAELPPDRIWRAGINQVTTLTSETDLMIGGKKVPKGKYSLYLHCPADGNWSLVVNSDLGVPLGKIWAAAPANLANEPWPHLQDYQKNAGAKEIVRAPLKKGTAAAAEELFTIRFAPEKDSALLTFAWGDQTWSVDVQAAK